MSAGVVAAAAAGCPSFWLLCYYLLLLLLMHCCCRGLPSCCSFCCRLLALAAPLLGLPLVAPLLLRRILGRTIVCSTVLPSPGLELTTAPSALANQQLSLFHRTCLTRPSQDSVSASLSKVRTLIRSSNEDQQQLYTSRLSLSTNCSVTDPHYRGRPCSRGPYRRVYKTNLKGLIQYIIYNQNHKRILKI